MFGAQAEAACQNDHRDDVRGVFAWAFAEASESADTAIPDLAWPTDCVELNDIVEAHLGNPNNVDIYQRVFGTQAEAACRKDHRAEVQGVFAWAFGNGLAAADAPRLPPPPAALNLDPFYKKYLDANGLPIVASDQVPDEALIRAKDIIDEMLALRSDIRATIAEMGVRVVIMSESEVTTDIPEWSDLNEASPDTDWDIRARGLGATTARPATGAGEENLLCYAGDRYRDEDILIHEFAHTVLLMGVERLPGGDGFRARLEHAYSRALKAGLWTHTYAGENADEYWAEGVQSWFGLNALPGGVHNNINTRTELEVYDPSLAGLIREVFGDVTISSSCHETLDIHNRAILGRVLGPNGEPLDGIGLWAWQGERANSGYARTETDGNFRIWVPDGRFRLDIYAGSADCNFVGWYGPGGFTTAREKLTWIEIEGETISGIEIRLPAEPDDLPPAEWCS